MTLRGPAVLLALAGLLAGCGAGGAADTAGTPVASAPTSTRSQGHADESPPAGSCMFIGKTQDGPLRLCPEDGDHGTFVVGEGETVERLLIPPPGPTSTAFDAGRVGHWAWAALAPDGETLLAQWSAECESPVAFLVSLPAGTPRPATGETDWAKSPTSEALGWTTDRRAIVFLPNGRTCGSQAEQPGVYLYEAPGAGERILPTHSALTSPVRRALSPRSQTAIANARS